jgi:hypothetical protein
MTLARSTSTQRTHIGAESLLAPGTPVAGTKRLPNLMLSPYPNIVTKETRGQGNKYPSSYPVGQDYTDFTYTGDASYAELAYIGASLFGSCVPVVVGSTGYSYAFGHSATLPDLPQSYSFEHGDPTTASKFSYGVFDSMTMAITRDEVKINGTGFGTNWVEAQPLTLTNAVQTLTITGSPTGGTFTLTFQGATTAPIPWNATVAQTQAALAALATLGTANVLVAGTAMPAGSQTITFQGDMASASVPAITGSGALLTATGTVVLTQTTAGSPTMVENVMMLPNQVTIAVDSTFGTVGNTALTTDYSATLAFTGRWGRTWPVQGALASWGQLTELVPKMSLKVEVQHTAEGIAFLSQMRGNTTRYLMIKGVGPVINGAVTYLWQIFFPFQVVKMNPLKDLAGVYVGDWDLGPVIDPATGLGVQASVVCKNPSL